MSRKHYIAIAAALRAARHHAPAGEILTPAAVDFNCGITAAARAIAYTLAQDNPRFDNAKFITACGVN